MSKPIIADNKPLAVHLEEDNEYHWCSCGHSENQPFCDGSHQGTLFTPLGFTAEEQGVGKVWLCMCKDTKNPPYCDSTCYCYRTRYRRNTIQ